MPNRILRDGILDSERVNRLDDEEEVFYRRLMSIVDDHGRWEAHRAKLRARLYPLKLDTKTEQRVGDLLIACVRERLVYVYPAEGKTFLQVLDFRQQARSESKHPPPHAAHVKSFAAHTLSPAETQQMLAHAQQMIAGAHLGVFVFGGVGGDVFGVGDVVVGAPPGRAAAPTTTTKPSPKETKPKDVEAVIAYGRSLDLSAAECEKFYRYNHARKWKGARSYDAGWRDLLVAWQSRASELSAADTASGKNSSASTAADFDPSKPHAHTGGLPESRPDAP